jgi:hypothetical protein
MDEVQSFISYFFTDISLLEKALTAPGADGDKRGMGGERDKYEGNRMLSKIGFSFRELAVHNREWREEKPSDNLPARVP